MLLRNFVLATLTLMSVSAYGDYSELKARSGLNAVLLPLGLNLVNTTHGIENLLSKRYPNKLGLCKEAGALNTAVIALKSNIESNEDVKAEERKTAVGESGVQSLVGQLHHKALDLQAFCGDANDGDPINPDREGNVEFYKSQYEEMKPQIANMIFFVAAIRKQSF